MKKRILTIGGILLLALLLADAAFIGGHLLNGQGLPARSLSELRDVPAKELPQTPADLVGLFDHRQDQSIFVQRPGKEPSLATSSITYEAVVTPQTKIYQDVTDEQFNGPPPEGPTQQVVEPGSLDGIGDGSQVTVWGKKTGNRILADVLVYTPPAFIKP